MVPPVKPVRLSNAENGWVAVATPLVAMRQFDTAITVVEAAIDGIQEFLEQYHQEHRAEQCAERKRN